MGQLWVRSLLDFVLRALHVLRLCDPRNAALDSDKLKKITSPLLAGAVLKKQGDALLCGYKNASWRKELLPNTGWFF